MKWIFLAALLILTPFLAVYLRHNRQHLPKAAFLLGLLPFIEARFNVSASPYTWPMWQGFVKGIDVSLIDSLALAMIFAGTRIKSPLRLRLAVAFYALFLAVSTAIAETSTPSLFYVWQLVRAIIVYYAVARSAMANNNVPIFLLSGLIAGISIQAFVVLQQRLQGVSQASGWWGHQNLLGMTTHFVAYPALASFLGGFYSKRAAICVVSAFVIAWAGGSRATILLISVGCLLTIVLSCRRRLSSRKLTVAALMAVSLLAATPILYMAIERRSAEARAGSSQEREHMKKAAAMIAADYPLGVGANRYVAVANVGGYNARAGLAWTSAAAPVHNTYYLVAAEMGLAGLIAFISIFVAALSLSIGSLRTAPPGFGAEYAIGTTVVLLMLAAHSYVEWITMLYSNHVLFAMTIGVIVALRGIISVRHRPPQVSHLATNLMRT